jgi:hypothetical protein
MAGFYDTCDPDVKEKADNLIRMMQSGGKRKSVLPNTGEDFSDGDAFNRLDLITKSPQCDEIIRSAYDC